MVDNPLAELMDYLLVQAGKLCLPEWEKIHSEVRGLSPGTDGQTLYYGLSACMGDNQIATMVCPPV